MIALVLVESDILARQARECLEPLGFEVVWYSSPLKALDNLEEINPSAVIICATDYPRHWKVIIQLLNTKMGRKGCISILLHDDSFSVDEAAKATYLGITAIMRSSLGNSGVRTLFQRLINRHFSTREKRISNRALITHTDHAGFVFSHPETGIVVPGKLLDLSSTGCGFLPETPSLTADLKPDTVLEECTIRIGKSIFSVRCRVQRIVTALGLSFVDLGEKERTCIEDFLKLRSAKVRITRLEAASSTHSLESNLEQ